ncbi:hypothetical protein GCM10023334_061460 [Nonomuraea thailandensis]
MSTTARAAASCAVTAIALTTLSAPSAVADTGPSHGGSVVEIQTHADKCFDVAGISAEDGAPIIQFGCDEEVHQRFNIRRLADGSVTIQTFNGKCLDVRHGSADDGAPIVQFRCHLGANQRFRFAPASRGRVEIRTFAGKCLDVREGSLNDGAPIVQFQCHRGANQRFLLVSEPWFGM